MAENISAYDNDDNHSHSSLDDENTDCHESDYQHGYPLDPFNLIDHSDLDSSWNSDQDSWFSLKNSPGHPPVSLESPATEANPHEAIAEEQPLAFQPTESPVVMANGPSCTPTPPYQDELAAGNDIPRVQEYSSFPVSK